MMIVMNHAWIAIIIVTVVVMVVMNDLRTPIAIHASDVVLFVLIVWIVCVGLDAEKTNCGGPDCEN